MPKQSRKKQKPNKSRKPDANQLAALTVARVTGQSVPQLTADGKNPYAVALGRLGGLKGGIARRDKLTPEERRASASKAARAKWDALRAKGK